MAKRIGKVKALAAVPDISGCTNFGCMAIDGQKAWGVKTNGAQTMSVVYYYADAEKKVTRMYKIKNLLGHGNGMTNDKKYLYFACGLVGSSARRRNRYILRVPRGFNGN